MKLIKSNYEIIEQQPGLDGIYKAIESAGRTCYKSEDKITDNYFIDDKIVPPDTEVLRQDGYATVKEFVDNGIFEVNFNGTNIKMKKESSAKEFVDRMIKSGHHAMLEFGTVYLKCKCGYNSPLSKYKSNKYSKYTNDVAYIDETPNDTSITYNHYVVTNYRVLVENNWLDDLKYLCEPTDNHEKRICVRFTCSIGISRELNRHRVDSIAEQSTRYCNFSKDKFGNEITFIIPSWSNLKAGNNSDIINQLNIENKANYDFIIRLLNDEAAYFNMINNGMLPQEARDILPLATATVVNHCAFVSDWKHFFDLRDDSHAHPDMQALAKPLHQEFINRKLLE